MIVKFHSRGTGGGAGPVDYLLGKYRDRPEATLLRGNAEIVATIIDSSPYTKKYTSGVLSFQEADLPMEAKDKLISSFERALFPGLEADQYACLWVEHRDKGRLELNFVVPNIELQSGKRLQPYFDRADLPRINAWKVCANAHFKLHDPDDPVNKRELVTPRNLPSHKQEASQAITAGLLHLANSGQIKNRENVIEVLQATGFTIARTTKRSISIKDPDGGQNIRLKGKLYEQDFRFGAELRGEIEEASKRYRTDTERRVREARTIYKRGIEIKREENQRRHSRPTVTSEKTYAKKLDMDARDTHEYSDRCLGDSLDTREHDRQQLGDNQLTEKTTGIAGNERRQDSTGTLQRQREFPSLCVDRHKAGLLRERHEIQLHDTQGILKDHDRARESFVERIYTIGKSIQRATQVLANGTKKFTRDVRNYFKGKQPLATASAELERTSQIFKKQHEEIDRFVQHEISTHKSKKNYVERNGPTLGL